MAMKSTVVMAAVAVLVSCGGMQSGSDAGTGGGSVGGGAAGGAATGGGAGGGSAGGSATGGGAAGGSAGGAGGGVAETSFTTDVFPTIQFRCAGCHNNDFANRATAFARLHSTASEDECMGQPRIVSGNADASLVVKKLEGTQDCGVRMPLVNGFGGCSGNTCLEQTDIDKMRRWINEGAKDN